MGRLSRGVLAIATLWILTACASTTARQTSLVAAPAATRNVAEQYPYLTFGSITMGRLIAGVGGRGRGCGQARIDSLNGGSPMEIDVLGTGGPRCAAVLAQLRRAHHVLTSGTEGRVAQWTCLWTPLPAIGCRRDGVVLAASNPGG